MIQAVFDIDIIRWTGSTLRYLDQTRLPVESVVEETDDYQNVIDAIRKLKIRGAPLIGIAAAYGILIAARANTHLAEPSFYSAMDSVCNEFAASRPTAVNLFWAIDRVKNVLAVDQPVAAAVTELEALAMEIHDDDRRRCDAIGAYGAEIVPEGARILTHCNAGALATGGIGTAIGVFVTAHRQGKNIHVYADETRPLLQGARLTMWELMQHDIPATLLTDNMAAMVMAVKGIDVIVTGADRIAANGDSANKIGTYGLAIIAKHHGIPFYIAAPKSTIDMTIATGKEIPIEERGTEEITEINNRRLAPEGANVFAPAFDVTPNELIAGIITEDGIIRAPYVDGLRNLIE